MIKIVKNKYFIVFFAFVVWMLFFDESNVIYTIKQKYIVEELKRKKEYYIKKHQEDSITWVLLNTSRKTLEHFGREKYFLKKKNEDIFIIYEDSIK